MTEEKQRAEIEELKCLEILESEARKAYDATYQELKEARKNVERLQKKLSDDLKKLLKASEKCSEKI